MNDELPPGAPHIGVKGICRSILAGHDPRGASSSPQGEMMRERGKRFKPRPIKGLIAVVIEIDEAMIMCLAYPHRRELESSTRGLVVNHSELELVNK